MAKRLEGRVALVTGAARGQGREHARVLSSEGASIIALDICKQIDTVSYPLGTEEELEETVRIAEENDVTVFSRKADVRDLDSLTAAVNEAVSSLGRLDIVCANAGICSLGTTEEMSAVMWQDMIDVNLTGVWNTCKAAIPHLVANPRGGAIVITSSVAGLKGMANIGHYVAAKHGLVGLMRTLVNELSPHNIRVNTVHPTNVDTPMIQNDAIRALYLPDDPDRTRDKFAQASQEALSLLPVPWVDPVDVSNAVLFLVSDEARYITGATLPIDAGMLQK